MEQRCGNQSEILDMCPEEDDGLDICRRFGILDGLEFLFAGLESLGCKTQEGVFLVSKNAFFQIDFQVIFVQPGKDIVEDGEVFFMSVCVQCTLGMSCSTPSMSLWYLAKQPRSMGDVIQYNWPFSGNRESGELLGLSLHQAAGVFCE